jgi:hypothetical protein
MGEPICAFQSVLDGLREQLGLVGKWHPGERRAALEAQCDALVRQAQDMAHAEEMKEMIRFADERQLWPTPPPRQEVVNRLTVIYLVCMSGCLKKESEQRE